MVKTSTSLKSQSKNKQFSRYMPDYTDDASNSHGLCTGAARCCDGGVWGDTVPSTGQYPHARVGIS